jgi:hypothetical protein
MKAKLQYSQMMRKASFRKSLAAVMTTSLRRKRDYEVVARRAFLQDVLGQGDLPVYQRDPEVMGFAIGGNANAIVTIIENDDSVQVPLFELNKWVGIPEVKLRERRFDIRQRIKTYTKSEIYRKEDRKIFAMMKIACDNNLQNMVGVPFGTPVTVEHFLDAMAIVENHSNVVANIFMAPSMFNVVRKGFINHFIPFSINERLISSGTLGEGTFYGAVIHVSPECPKDYAFFCAEPEAFGVMPIGMDLSVVQADDSKNRLVGFSIAEQIGAYIHNATYGLSYVKYGVQP